MFTIITEHRESQVETIEQAINLAWQETLAGCTLVMIETDQGFIVNLRDLDEAYQKQQAAFKEISA